MTIWYCPKGVALPEKHFAPLHLVKLKYLQSRGYNIEACQKANFTETFLKIDTLFS